MTALRVRLFRLAICSVPLLFPFIPLPGDEWPQWRGPDRDGVWHETGIIEKFDQPELKIEWRAEISSGYSGPTVAGGRAYVMDRVIDPTQVERVHCFDAVNGRTIWTHTYDCFYRDVGYPAGPRASVTIDDGRAYSLGTMGHFFCLDAAKGTVLWKKDLNAEYKIRMPSWGITASPLVEGDLIILQIGGKEDACLVAFDKTTGEERWRALKDPASYSSPIVIEQAGKRVLVCWTGERVVGLDPRSGELYWAYPFPPVRFVRSIATPVHHKNWLFFSAFFDGSLLLKLGRNELTVERQWYRVGESEQQTDGLHTNISTAFFEGDYIYGIDSYGELRCLDAHTGKRLWEEMAVERRTRWFNIFFVRNRDRVWMLNERGELIIGEFSPEGYKEISRAKLLKPTSFQLPSRRGGVCWSHPAFAYKRVFARNDEELVCASLEAK